MIGFPGEVKSGPLAGHAGCVLTVKLTILGSGADGVLVWVFGAAVVTTVVGGALLLDEDSLVLAGLDGVDGALLETVAGVVEAGADTLSVAEPLAAAGVLRTAEPLPADVLEQAALASSAVTIRTHAARRW